MGRKTEKAIIALVALPIGGCIFAADLQDLTLVFPPVVVAALVGLCLLVLLFFIVTNDDD